VTNYNTNYNTVYPISNQPIANQPLTNYVPGSVGTPVTALGVYFPGGDVSSVAPYIGETVVQYWQYPDSTSHPIPVPPGGQIVVKIE
jgi:hypothetical protein